MQHDNSDDDPYGFWNDEPTRQLKGTHTGTRSHAETRLVPVVRSDGTQPTTSLHRPRNPLVTRIAVMAGATLLLVPLALSLGDDEPQVRLAEIGAVDSIQVGLLPQPAPTQVTIAPTTAAPTTLAQTTTVAAAPARTEAVVITPAPTQPATTTPKVTKKAAPATTAAPAPTAVQSADKACAITYVIVKGDAWSSIASRAQVSMKALLAANGATVNTLLLPGKSICLPAGAVAPGPPATSPPTTKPPATMPPATTPPRAPAPQPTTPPASTAPPNTQPAPPANIYSKAQVAQIIRDVWPDDLEDEAIRIATRESNLIPTVRNSCCYGLFQIYYTVHRTWLASIGVTNASQLYDPQVNASAALALYYRSGWSPWALSSPTTTTA